MASAQSLYIPRFFTGLVTQRNPLMSPFSYKGLNVIVRHDALIGGSNAELSNNLTLQRRPGFPQYCSVAFGASEFPLNYYSFRMLNGTIIPIVDTNLNVNSFSTSAQTQLFSKGTTAQTHFRGVGSMLYMSNGTDLKKYNGTTVWNWGSPAPVTAPTLSYGAGTLSPQTGYQYVYCGRNSTTGTLTTASPASANTGPLTSQTITVSGSRLSDTQIDKIDVYRNLDGGPLFYFLATVNNPGVGGWTYADSTADSGLNTQLIAPVNHANDPPPAGMTAIEFHMGRFFGAVGNLVYFAAGGDCLNGIPEEAWPPGNVFKFPSSVYRLVSTTQGLLVFTRDALYAILGVDTLSFYSTSVMQNFGILSPNAVAADGDQLYVYTTGKQLFSLAPGTAQQEIGYDIGDQLAANFNPANVYLTSHRNGSDAGLFISDGSTNVARYSFNTSTWSALYQLAGSGGVNCLKSIEVTAGNYALLAGRNGNAGYILYRNLTTFTDDSASLYSWNAIVGSIRLSQPGEDLAAVDSILYERMPVGSDPTVSVLVNDISGTFSTLPAATPEPPQLNASTGVIAKRLDMTASGAPTIVRHLQLKFAFPAEAFKNELLGLAIAPPEEAPTETS